MSKTSATPTKLNSIVGLFKKKIWRPPTIGITVIKGFITTRTIPCNWKSLMPPFTPDKEKVMSQSPA